MMKLLLIVISLFFTLATPQDCPLPTIADIETALSPLLIISDGTQTYSPNVTEGSVQYVCQAQGSMIDTYHEVSLIATFTPNPGEAETTRIMSLVCNSGAWSGVTNDGLPAPPASVVGVTRTDCYRCRASFATDRCRMCDSACDTGLERCTGSGSGDCCLVFLANGDCSDDCLPSGVNYAATNITNYVCTCNLTCTPGYSPNNNCTECISNNICDTNDPCLNGGVCSSLSTNKYTCNCTGTGYQGINCSDSYSTSSMPLPSVTSTRPTASSSFVTTRMMTSSPTLSPSPSPSPSPSLCRADNCGECASDSVCCTQCNDGYKIDEDGCTCAISNDPIDVTLIIIIIAIVVGLILLLIIGALIAFCIYSYATKGKKRIFPLKKLQVV